MNYLFTNKFQLARTIAEKLDEPTPGKITISLFHIYRILSESILKQGINNLLPFDANFQTNKTGFVIENDLNHIFNSPDFYLTDPNLSDIEPVQIDFDLISETRIDFNKSLQMYQFKEFLSSILNQVSDESEFVLLTSATNCLPENIRFNSEIPNDIFIGNTAN